jgi:hypothetical protein
MGLQQGTDLLGTKKLNWPAKAGARKGKVFSWKAENLAEFSCGPSWASGEGSSISASK